MYGFELITMSDCCKNIIGVTFVSKHIISCYIHKQIFINQTIVQIGNNIFNYIYYQFIIDINYYS